MQPKLGYLMEKLFSETLDEWYLSQVCESGWSLPINSMHWRCYMVNECVAISLAHMLNYAECHACMVFTIFYRAFLVLTSSHLLECQIICFPSQFLNTTLQANTNSVCLYVFNHLCSGAGLHKRKMYYLFVCYTAGDMIKEIPNLKYLGHTILLNGKLRT